MALAAVTYDERLHKDDLPGQQYNLLRDTCRRYKLLCDTCRHRLAPFEPFDPFNYSPQEPHGEPALQHAKRKLTSSAREPKKKGKDLLEAPYVCVRCEVRDDCRA